MWLFFLWLGVYLFSLFTFNRKTIIYVPIFLILSKLSTQLLGYNEYNRATTLIGYLTVFFVLFISIVEIRLNIDRVASLKKLYSRILVFVGLIFILVFIGSSDVWVSFKRSLYIQSSLLLFLALYLKNIPVEWFKKGVRAITVYLALFVVNFLLLSVFRIGPYLSESFASGGYSSDFLRTGSFTFFELHGMMILSALILFFRKTIKEVFIRNTFFTSAIIILLLAFLTYKRTYMLTLVSGIILHYVIFVVTSKKLARNIIIASISLAFIIFISSSYIAIFINMRSSANTSEALENAGRLMEFSLYPEVVNSQENSVFFALFGSEIFNSTGKYSVLNVFGASHQRTLHNDFSHLLYGTGIIGLGLYISILSILFKKTYLYLKSKSTIIKQYAGGAMILLVALVISSIGDGILSFHNRVVPYYAIGLFLGAANTQNRLLYGKR